MSDLSAKIASQLNLPPKSVRSAVQLLNDGNTIPFVARYRKEATGGLDEIALRAVEDAMETANAFEARRTSILKSLRVQGVLSAELQAKVDGCDNLRSLEAIYLPFKPKRRTRATIARERGLAPLADLLRRQQKLNQSRSAVLRPYVDSEREVPDAETALSGALDIIAEHWSEVAETREWLLGQAMQYGKIASKLKRGKKSVDGADKFEQYFDRQESVAKIPGHRILAMLRGASEGILNVRLVLEGDREVSQLKRRLVTNREFEFHRDLLGCVEDSFQRLLMPSIESAVVAQLKESADAEAIEVFGKNLYELLMAPPAGPKVTMGIDPGFRTGCKVAVVDGTGQFLENATIYPTAPRHDTTAATKTLVALIKKFKVELIAIGNGTASRETDVFVGKLLKEFAKDSHDALTKDIAKVMVSESGASIYSASDVAVKEFPDLDVTVRGAISIARRLQDPLAELVKTDPKSIGVGQYQHDVNQTKLRRCLDRVVQSCVNSVGVDVNMASAPLLSYVAGIGPKLADNIVNYRNDKGRFSNRRQLTKVAKLGEKAYEQCAGFLRIADGDQPLDNSAVHPATYSIVERMAADLNADVKSLVGNSQLVKRLQPQKFADEQFGLPTINDIVAELAKPGRDPRKEFAVAKFDDQVNSIEDLRPNMVLEGVITNVTHFGAFVDIGVHQDALIHISQLSDEFVSDPNDVVSVGQIAKVKILEIDVGRKRISATRKLDTAPSAFS